MPKAGKPRKKYKPKRTLVGNIRGGANILAKLSVSNEPLDELTIQKTLLPFKQFIEKLKTGEANSQIFYNACAFHYQYITILEVISRSKINADAETEMLARLQNSVRKDTAINVIVPLHGPIWRTPEDVNYLLDLHNKWSTNTPEKQGVVLIYGSMYGNTENTVNCIANKLAQKGVKDIKVFDVSKTHPSYIISDAWKYSNLVLAAPTYNTGLYLVMDSLFHELAALSYQNRKVSLIGNHTWATGALGAMKKKFETEFKKIEIVGEPLDVKSALRPEQEEILDNLVEAIVESMK